MPTNQPSSAPQADAPQPTDDLTAAAVLHDDATDRPAGGGALGIGAGVMGQVGAETPNAPISSDLARDSGAAFGPPYTLENYAAILRSASTFRWLLNSMIVSLLTTAGVLLLCSLAVHGALPLPLVRDVRIPCPTISRFVFVAAGELLLPASRCFRLARRSNLLQTVTCRHQRLFIAVASHWCLDIVKQRLGVIHIIRTKLAAVRLLVIEEVLFLERCLLRTRACRTTTLC